MCRFICLQLQVGWFDGEIEAPTIILGTQLYIRNFVGHTSVTNPVLDTAKFFTFYYLYLEIYFLYSFAMYV